MQETGKAGNQGGNETWLKANGTAQEAEEEEGERKGVEDRERVFPCPLYILGVWEGLLRV